MTKEQQMTLLIQVLDKKEYLPGKMKTGLYHVGNRYWGKTDYLYRMYKALLQQKPEFRENNEFISYETREDGLYFICEEEELPITRRKLKNLLISYIDVCEKILPLGTLVELKSEFMKEAAPQGSDNLKIIITHRFLDYTDSTYFHYAGVPYPTGMLGSQNVIHLSSALIQSVIQEGFADEMEETYVHLMKEEFLVDRDMHSVGFATEEEKNELRERMESNE
ncbi:DUF4176 domain-containing protein [Anaerosacchariphilus polymeriproducens]|uniref:DUF4176 domain-containing protein n=1 Tax=Anaerosacchariphilus polymeriproducens TaxID=1812858 RepID=A0A371AY88_9FIRM|nr:DUF4176 domain-containing protein [Anaerosacchariphilus polymeriproducens]RDU24555.1 DUF4176 domain-containing protein [Anaerosacchariphilus polymeriproducens]